VTFLRACNGLKVLVKRKSARFGFFAPMVRFLGFFRGLERRCAFWGQNLRFDVSSNIILNIYGACAMQRFSAFVL